MSNGASVDGFHDVTEQLTPSTSLSSTVSRKGKALKKKVVDVVDVPLSTFVIDESASTSGTAPPPVSRMRLTIANNTFDSIEFETNNGIDKSIDDSASTYVTSPPNKKRCVPSTLKQLKLPYQKRYAGRPRTSKASHFADYTKAPKSFLFKNTSEKIKVIFFSLSYFYVFFF